MPNDRKAVRQQLLDWIEADQDALVDFLVALLPRHHPILRAIHGMQPNTWRTG